MSVVVRRYTRALYELSDTQGVSELIWEDLRQFGNVFMETPDLLEVARNPLISRTQACAALETLCLHADFHPLTTSFIKLLTIRRRLKLLPEILKDFEKRIDMRLGLIRGELESARTLARTNVVHLEEALSQKLKGRVQLKTAVNSRLLGGVIVRVGSYLMDASLETQLAYMQKKLKGQK